MANNPDEYLNDVLFHSIISKHFISTPFKIVSVEHSSATSSGQNFLSTILRNRIYVEHSNGTKEAFSFISKIVGSTMFDEKVVEDMKVFPKEVESYVNIVPEFEKIWKDVAGINVNFGPKLYYYELEPHKILIFEDLNEDGFQVRDRFRGLTEAEIYVVLKKISMWHAASRIYFDRRDFVDSIFRKGLYNSGATGFMDSYNKVMYRNLMETLSTAGIDDAYMEAIEKWNNQLLSNMLKILEVDPNAFNCLNHGDLWINNLMLRNNESLDVKLLDFQLGYYGSPVIELIYFLTMSTNHELLTEKFDIFIAYYHRQLQQSLTQLKYHKIPTLKEIWIALLEKSFYLCLTIVIALPSLLLDYQKHNIDVTVLQQDNTVGYQTRKKVFEEPIVVAALKNLITFFGKRGMLDL